MIRVMVLCQRLVDNRDVHSVMESRIASPSHVRLRPIALPAEHGGWGMLGAPILTGLLLAPSWSGLCLSAAGAAAFLTRQPFRLALIDLRKGKRYPRTAWAVRFAVLYAILGLSALAGAIILAGGPFWLPIAIAATLGAIQFTFDIRSKGRSFIPEICGASAMALLAAGIVQSAGFSPSKSWLPSLALVLQSATAISYASVRVRLARNILVPRWPVWLGHVCALAAVLGISLEGWMRWPVVAAFLVLTLRASWGLSAYRRNVRAAMVGLQEVGYALLMVAAIWLSMR